MLAIEIAMRNTCASKLFVKIVNAIAAEELRMPFTTAILLEEINFGFIISLYDMVNPKSYSPFQKSGEINTKRLLYTYPNCLTHTFSCGLLHAYNKTGSVDF